MKNTEFYPLQNVLLALCGILLFIATYFAANNALSTYVDGEKSRQSSAWSALQLYKEIRKMSFQSGLYTKDMTSKASLKVAYEILWSRISVTKVSLLKDDVFINSNKSDFDTLLLPTFEHIQAIEPNIFGDRPLDKRYLASWTSTLESYANSISMTFLHDLISTDSDYSKEFRNNIIKAVGLLVVAILAVLLYLVYILFALWKQRCYQRHLLNHDTLTGLYSRDCTMKKIKANCQHKIPFTLLSFDINKFKQINDGLGHLAGDDLLKYLGTVAAKSLSQHGFVGRIGGDEFLWIVESEDQNEINNYYASFLKLLEQPCFVQESAIYLQVSTGACLASDCHYDLTSLLERVDEAMYCAKKNAQRKVFWQENTDTPLAFEAIAEPLQS